MAGEVNLALPGFNISPPLLSRQMASPNLLQLSSRRPQLQSPQFTNRAAFTPGADETGQHQANIFLAKNDLSNTGQWRPNIDYSNQPVQMPIMGGDSNNGGGSNKPPFQMPSDIPLPPQDLPGYPSYGFTPQDWDTITRYMTNPQNNQNVNLYYGIVNRLRNIAGTNPQMAEWLPSQRETWATNMPIALAGAYNILPPQILQNWGIMSNAIPGLRF